MIFFQRSFWRSHCQIHRKRPLFSSPPPSAGADPARPLDAGERHHAAATLYHMGEDRRDGLKLFGFHVALHVLIPFTWFGMRMKQLADSGYLVDHMWATALRARRNPLAG